MMFGEICEFSTLDCSVCTDLAALWLTSLPPFGTHGSKLAALRLLQPEILCLLSQRMPPLRNQAKAVAQPGHDFAAAFCACSYEGEHLSRTGGRSDGCATFW
jgi:hypothetical protein